MNYQTAYRRWVGIGPYYAMFPTQFVESTIEQYTQPGDWILDPFAGRASTMFVGASLGRSSLGVEINPVGWVYGKTKLSPAPKDDVLKRLAQICSESKNQIEIDDNFQEFFSLCYSQKALDFLISARKNLDWQNSDIDRTLMAFILIDLHGPRHRAFSNQMRQSKSMAPDYSVEWWKKYKLFPPEVEPLTFIQKKIDWRYAKGFPSFSVQSNLILGDSTEVLDSFAEPYEKKVKLLFTSPPYIDITDYHRDQWLRLWMLGEKLSYKRRNHKYQATFSSLTEYENLLLSVFQKASMLVSDNGYVYVRTDARKNTFEITLQVLNGCFSGWKYKIIEQPYSKNTQTALFGDKSTKPGEKDIVFFREGVG
jgi:hypothetical protein